MSTILEFPVQLETIDCHKCGATYALNQHYITKRREDGESWTCPYCRAGTHFGETEVAKLKKQLDIKERQIQQQRQAHDQTTAELRETELRRRAQKAQTTKLKNRIAAGTCPCCNQQFDDLQHHMEKEHPEFTADDEP